MQYRVNISQKELLAYEMEIERNLGIIDITELQAVVAKIKNEWPAVADTAQHCEYLNKKTGKPLGWREYVKRSPYIVKTHLPKGFMDKYDTGAWTEPTPPPADWKQPDWAQWTPYSERLGIILDIITRKIGMDENADRLQYHYDYPDKAKAVKIYKMLRQKNILRDDCSESDWVWVMTGKGGADAAPKDPIVWHGKLCDLATTLGAMIGRQWNIVEHCFIWDKKGSLMLIKQRNITSSWQIARRKNKISQTLYDILDK